MDSSDASKNKKQDTSSSSQPSPEPSYLGYLNSLSPISQNDNTYDDEDHFLLGEHFYLTPPRLSFPPATQLFESDITGGEGLIEDPCNTKNLSLLSEEPDTVHQENPSYVDEPGIQDVEWPSQESLHCVQEWFRGSENLWEDGSEASQNLRDLTCCMEYAEAASNSLGSNNLPSHISEGPVSSSAPSYVTSSKPPSGVLHLNSLLKATPPSATTDMGSAEGLKSKRMKYRLKISPYMPGIPTVRVSTIDESPEIDASAAADFVTSESPSFIEPFTSPSYPETASVHDDNKKTSPTDHAGNPEEFNQPRPPKTKKRQITAETEDLTRCTCKRSACAKLYCECFAAELYCGEPCSCLGCLNRPEFRDKIHNIRKQIISRNRFAFAPKIVQNVIDIPSNNTEYDTMKTPPSARHRKGCHCMKSKCLKNYCECFEVKVGCSSACRCQGCKNSYGKKEGENQQDDMNKERESGRVEEVSELLHAEPDENDVHGLSPITPSLQCSDVTGGASSLDWTHSPRGRRSISFSGGPLPQQSSPMTNVQGLESSSSGGLVKGRKYILKSVPSFPPLTPSIEEEDDEAREPEKRL